MNIPKNHFTQNKVVQNPYVKKGAKFFYRNLVGAVKRIVPGVCVMTCAFYVNHTLNNTSMAHQGQQVHQNSLDAASWAYKAGEQRVKDSLQIVELKKQIAADSVKIYELTKKAGLDKAIKK